MFSGNYSLNPEYIFYRVYQLFSGNVGFDDSNFLAALAQFWFWFRTVSIVLTFVLLCLVIYVARKIMVLRHGEHLALREMLQATQVAKPDINEDWQKVLNYMSSDNPNDWKLGIIEADNLLDRLVKTMSLPGESLGERLKNVEPSDFTTLNEAWEAHKVRNRIAHESGYVPTENEARRAIANYRQVFEEFKII